MLLLHWSLHAPITPLPSCKYIAGILGLAESCTTRVIPTSIATLHSSSLAICAYAKLIFMKSYYNVQISYLVFDA